MKKKGVVIRRIKHLIAVILALGMVMACSMVSFAAEPPAQNYAESVFAGSTAKANEISPDYVDRYCKVIADGVRLRRDPGVDGEILGYFYAGNSPWVRTTGAYVSMDNETWMRVSDSSLGLSGWIAKRYIRYKN